MEHKSPTEGNLATPPKFIKLGSNEESIRLLLQEKSKRVQETIATYTDRANNASSALERKNHESYVTRKEYELAILQELERTGSAVREVLIEKIKQGDKDKHVDLKDFDDVFLETANLVKSSDTSSEQ